MGWLEALLGVRRGRVGTAGFLLGLYLVGMGILLRQVPGLASGGCPVGQPCDPLMVNPYARVGMSIVGVGIALAVLDPLVYFVPRLIGGRRDRVRSTPSSLPVTPARFSLLVQLSLYLLAAFVVALGVAVLVLIWRSPITCEGGGGGGFCPPDGILDLLFIVLGGNVTAVALIGASRYRVTRSRRSSPAASSGIGRRR
jgi:hypothetical protein